MDEQLRILLELKDKFSAQMERADAALESLVSKADQLQGTLDQTSATAARTGAEIAKSFEKSERSVESLRKTFGVTLRDYRALSHVQNAQSSSLLLASDAAGMFGKQLPVMRQMASTLKVIEKNTTGIISPFMRVLYVLSQLGEAVEGLRTLAKMLGNMTRALSDFTRSTTKVADIRGGITKRVDAITSAFRDSKDSVRGMRDELAEYSKFEKKVRSRMSAGDREQAHAEGLKMEASRTRAAFEQKVRGRMVTGVKQWARESEVLEQKTIDAAKSVAAKAEKVGKQTAKALKGVSAAAKKASEDIKKSGGTTIHSMGSFAGFGTLLKKEFDALSQTWATVKKNFQEEVKRSTAITRIRQKLAESMGNQTKAQKAASIAMRVSTKILGGNISILQGLARAVSATGSAFGNAGSFILNFRSRISAAAAASGGLSGKFAALGLSVGGATVLVAGLVVGLGIAITAFMALKKTLTIGQEKFIFVEQAQLQFKYLMGSAEEAETKIAELMNFAKRTPFREDEIIKAQRLLLSFGGEALATKETIELLGDAAAVSGRSFDRIAMWVGRAYTALQAGRPMGQAAMEMQELGVLTATARMKMEDMLKTGASGDEVFAVLLDSMRKNSGAMAELSLTLGGLKTTFADTWAAVWREMFEVIAPLFKWFFRQGIQIGEMAGTIVGAVKATAGAFGEVARVVGYLIPVFDTSGDAFDRVGAFIGKATDNTNTLVGSFKSLIAKIGILNPQAAAASKVMEGMFVPGKLLVVFLDDALESSYKLAASLKAIRESGAKTDGATFEDLQELRDDLDRATERAMARHGSSGFQDSEEFQAALAALRELEQLIPGLVENREELNRITEEGIGYMGQLADEGLAAGQTAAEAAEAEFERWERRDDALQAIRDRNAKKAAEAARVTAEAAEEAAEAARKQVEEERKLARAIDQVIAARGRQIEANKTLALARDIGPGPSDYLTGSIGTKSQLVVPGAVPGQPDMKLVKEEAEKANKAVSDLAAMIQIFGQVGEDQTRRVLQGIAGVVTGVQGIQVAWKAMADGVRAAELTSVILAVLQVILSLWNAIKGLGETAEALTDTLYSVSQALGDVRSGALTVEEALDKAFNWQGNEEGFEFLQNAIADFEAVGRTAAEAEAHVFAYWEAMRRGDEGAMRRIGEDLVYVAEQARLAREEKDRLAEAEKAQLDALVERAKSVIEAYDAIKAAGTNTYNDIMAQALEAGKTEVEAKALATEASRRMIEYQTKLEQWKFVRLKVIEELLIELRKQGAEAAVKINQEAIKKIIDDWKSAYEALAPILAQLDIDLPAPEMPDLSDLTIGFDKATKSAGGLANAAGKLAASIDGIKRSLLGLPTEKAIEDFRNLNTVWASMNPDEKARGMDNYAAALSRAAKAGLDLRHAQQAIVARGRLLEIGDRLRQLDEKRGVENADAQIAAAEKQREAALESMDAQIAAAEKQREAALESMDAQIAAAEKQREAALESMDAQIAAAEKQREAALESMDAQIEAVEKQREVALESIDAQIEAVEKQREVALESIDAQIEDLEKQRDAALEAIDRETEAVKKQRDAALEAIDRETEAVRHRQKLYQEEHENRRRQIQDESDARLAAIDKEIKALEKKQFTSDAVWEAAKAFGIRDRSQLGDEAQAQQASEKIQRWADQIELLQKGGTSDEELAANEVVQSRMARIVEDIEKHGLSLPEHLADLADELGYQNVTIGSGLAAIAEQLEEAKRTRAQIEQELHDSLESLNIERERVEAEFSRQLEVLSSRRDAVESAYDAKLARLRARRNSVEAMHDSRLARLRASRDSVEAMYDSKLAGLRAHRAAVESAYDSKLAGLRAHRAAVESAYDSKLAGLRAHRDAVEAAYDLYLSELRARRETVEADYDSKLAGLRAHRDAVEAAYNKHLDVIRAHRAEIENRRVVRAREREEVEAERLRAEQQLLMGVVGLLDSVNSRSREVSSNPHSVNSRSREVSSKSSKDADLEAMLEAVKKQNDAALRAKTFSSGSGGIRDFGAGTPAMLHRREAVVSEDKWLEAIERAARGSGGGGGGELHVVDFKVGGVAFGRAVLKYQPKAAHLVGVR